MLKTGNAHKLKAKPEQINKNHKGIFSAQHLFYFAYLTSVIHLHRLMITSIYQ